MIDRLPHVEGLLNYLAPMAEKPMNLTYDPPPGVPRSTGIPEPHVMLIHDARPVASRLTLDGEGLAHMSIAARSRTSMTRTSCAASIIRKPYASSPRKPAPAGCWYSTIRSVVASRAASIAQLGRRASR